MKPHEFQSEPEPAVNYFNSGSDRGRTEFSARPEPSSGRPRFVVDAGEERHRAPEGGQAGNRSAQAPAIPSGENDKTFGRAADSPALTELSPEESQAEAGDARRLAGGSPFVDASPNWRDLVSAKVSSHRLQKPRKPRYPSLELPRSASLWGASKSAPVPGRTGTRESLVETTEEQSRGKSPAETAVVVGATARVLEFPRLVPMPARRDELAEPLIDRPRIVEAPELLPPPPAMGGILIETSGEPEPSRRPGFEIPLQSAPLDRRLCAGVVDGVMVAAAMALFGYVFFRITASVPPTKAIFQIGTSMLALLWAAYQYALLVFSGTTPGLKLTRIEVLGFDGSHPSRKLRRWRVLASLLSSASLGLGYAWCFLDEDELSWHDRITRTHLARRPSQKQKID